MEIQPASVIQAKVEPSAGTTQDKKQSVHRVAPKSFSIKSVISGVPPEPLPAENQNSKEGNSTDQTLPLSLEVESDEVEDTVTQFTLQDLINTWNLFISTKLSEKPNYANLLKNYPPILSDDFVIQVSFDNSLQIDMFKEIKHDLAIFLRKNLNNSILSLVEIVVEKENSKNMIYTVDEKYKYMSQKNPTLIKLKQQLNLDFE